MVTIGVLGWATSGRGGAARPAGHPLAAGPAARAVRDDAARPPVWRCGVDGRHPRLRRRPGGPRPDPRRARPARSWSWSARPAAASPRCCGRSPGCCRVAAGAVLADGAPVTGPSPDRALVFQDDALLPWRTARRNVELPLAIREVARARAPRRGPTRGSPGSASPGRSTGCPASSPAACGSGSSWPGRWPASPRAILMDEPFGALDAQTRAAMQRLLVEVLRSHPGHRRVRHPRRRRGAVPRRPGRRARPRAASGTLVDVPHPRDPADPRHPAGRGPPARDDPRRARRRPTPDADLTTGAPC